MVLAIIINGGIDDTNDDNNGCSDGVVMIEITMIVTMI